MNIPFPKNDFSPVNELFIKNISVQAVYESSKLKLYDILEKGPKSLEDLAGETGLVPQRLDGLLGLLKAHGLLENNGQGLWQNTPMASEFMVSTSPLYQGRAMELMMGFYTQTTQGMEDSLKGQDQKGHTDHNWATETGMEGTAQEAISGELQKAVQALAGLPGFEKFKLMADLGGNHGTYSMSLLDKNPDLKAVLVDFPHVAEVSEKRCARFGYANRMECAGLDFRADDLPDRKFDLVFASHSLYSLPEQLDGLVEKIVAKLSPGGWFASHHLDNHSTGRDDKTRAALQLMTNLSGYHSHFIDAQVLEETMAKHGLGNFQRTVTDLSRGTLLLAGQKTA